MILKIEGRFVVFSHNLGEVVIICPNINDPNVYLILNFPGMINDFLLDYYMIKVFVFI